MICRGLLGKQQKHKLIYNKQFFPLFRSCQLTFELLNISKTGESYTYGDYYYLIDYYNEGDELYQSELILNKMASVEGFRYVIELGPFIAQCVLMLAMSIERYILVCHGESVEQLLSKRRRDKKQLFSC